MRDGLTRSKRAVVFFLALLLMQVVFPTGSKAVAAGTRRPTAKPAWLTNAEWAFLTSHQPITLAPDPEFSPIESFDARGNYVGLAADYVNLIQRMLGTKFRIAHLDSWDEILDHARTKEVDLLAAAANTPQRRKYLSFVSPHLVLPGVIIVRDKVEDRLGITDLYGKSVAIVSGYVWEELVKARYPQIKVIPVKNVAAGLNKVAFGSVDAMIATLPVALNLIDKEGITGLRVAGETGLYTRLSFAVRNDWPILKSVLEKTLNIIPPSQKHALTAKWFRQYRLGTPFYRSKTFLVALTLTVGIIILLIFGAYAWNKSLRLQVSSRTRELRRSQNLLWSFINHVPASVSIKTLDGRYLLANRQHEQIFGVEAAPGAPPYSGKPLTPAEEAALAGQFRQVIATKTDVTREQAITINGEQHIFLTTLFPICSDFRDIDTIGMISTDITERKQMEANLITAKDDAERANRLKSQFLAHMSHELRTPLNSIIGFSEAMAEGIHGTITNRKYCDYLGNVLRSGRHLLDLINDVLDLSKIEAGEFELLDCDVDLDEILLDCVSMIEGKSDARSITIGLAQQGNLPRLRADRRAVTQIILNLLSNAVKYNVESGGVVISACLDESNAVVITVTDTGIGIEPNALTKVLEPFGQSRKDSLTTHEGTGLGLSLAKSLTELHGGSLTLESRLGRGTMVTILFPQERTLLR